jgi:hypothetical protein
VRFPPLYLLLLHSSSFISFLHPKYPHAGPTRHPPPLFSPPNPPTRTHPPFSLPLSRTHPATSSPSPSLPPPSGQGIDDPGGRSSRQPVAQPRRPPPIHPQAGGESGAPRAGGAPASALLPGAPFLYSLPSSPFLYSLSSGRLLTLLTSSTRNGYKIHLYRRHQKCKGIS